MIHLSTGSLSIFKPLDREEQDIFNLTIIAEDHGIPQHSSTQLLGVHVIDVNDEVPCFEESQYEAQISENQPPGTSVLTVSASDLDQGTTECVCLRFFVCMCVRVRVWMGGSVHVRGFVGMCVCVFVSVIVFPVWMYPSRWRCNGNYSVLATACNAFEAFSAV